MSVYSSRIDGKSCIALCRSGIDAPWIAGREKSGHAPQPWLTESRQKPRPTRHQGEMVQRTRWNHFLRLIHGYASTPLAKSIEPTHSQPGSSNLSPERTLPSTSLGECALFEKLYWSAVQTCPWGRHRYTHILDFSLGFPGVRQRYWCSLATNGSCGLLFM